MKLTYIVKIKVTVTLGKVLRKDWKSVRGVSSVLFGYRLYKCVQFVKIPQAAHLCALICVLYQRKEKKKSPVYLKDMIGFISI